MFWKVSVSECDIGIFLAELGFRLFGLDSNLGGESQYDVSYFEGGRIKKRNFALAENYVRELAVTQILLVSLHLTSSSDFAMDALCGRD